MSMDSAKYREKVMGCWLGKAVGGTLGQPYEGRDGPLDLEFYDPVPTDMIPNDDLDLQVLWACILDKMDTPRVDRHVLGRAWLDHVDFPMDEYGVAMRNMRDGVQPPLSGRYDNWFTQGMGAAIRSEIWACLAPGDPELAASYAREDACVDHAGEGMYAEMFLAALESAAFTESDCQKLLDLALMQLPVDSRVRCAVNDTRIWWRQRQDWREVRTLILARYGHENFTDVVMNMAFTVLGWLACDGDFGRGICTAVNCGKDTDCTGATLGALLGILDPASIGSRWLDPIGRDLVLSPEIRGVTPPDTLDGFTDLVLDLNRRLAGRAPEPVSAADTEEIPASLGVPVQAGSVEWGALGRPREFVPALPADAEQMMLPGTMASLPAGHFKEDQPLLLRYCFTLERSGKVWVMFNSPQNCRVWVDNAYVFGRECGRMAPSCHRVPLHQSTVIGLEAGEHFLWAAVAPPADGEEATWVAGVGDATTRQWLPGLFRA